MTVSFHDYDTLVKAIARTLARPDLEDDVPGWVWMTECSLQRRVNFREPNDAIFEGSATKGQDYVELPGDFIEGRYLQWADSNTPPVQVTSWDVTDRIIKEPSTQNSDQLVRVGTVHGNRIYVGSTPAEAGFTLYYKAGVRHLGDDVKTNKILQLYPDGLLYGSLLHSAPFLGADERIPTWLGFYEPIVKEAAQQEWRSRTGHGPLAMRPDIRVY